MRQLSFLILLFVVTACQKPDPTPPGPGPGPAPAPFVYGPFKVAGKTVVLDGIVKDGSKFGVKEAEKSFKTAASLIDK